MDLQSTLKQLEALGMAQNRKIYQRHGSGPELFGVSFANLKKLARSIKQDHELARGLWSSGNTDARVLAAMVADPAAASAAELDRWSRELDCYMITDAFVSSLVSRSPHALKKAARWSRARAEFTAAAGWQLWAHLALADDGPTEARLAEQLETIEVRIHKAPNRTRHSMNNALIAIALRSPRLERRALAAARRIGKVEVDHGQTSCKTPDATAYIAKAKAAARRRKRPR